MICAIKFQLLKNRALISLEGEDVLKFLQGNITNDIYQIKDAGILYSLMLTPQGRFLYDFFLFSYQNKIYLDHEAKFTQDIITKLNFYKLRADVTIHDISKEYEVLAIGDNNNLDHPLLFKDPRFPKLGFRAYVKKDESDIFIKKNNLAEHNFYTDAIYEHLIPEPHQDMIQEKSFPMEYSMDKFNAISFDKGCYLGQELTARTKHRGVVRKKLYKFISSTDLSYIETGTPISMNDSKIGIFCSSHGKIVKALLRIENYENYLKSLKESKIVVDNNYLIQGAD